MTSSKVSITLSAPLPAGTYQVTVPAATGTGTGTTTPPPVVTPPPVSSSGAVYLKGMGFQQGWDGYNWSSGATPSVNPDGSIGVKTIDQWGELTIDATALGGAPNNGTNGDYDVSKFTELVIVLTPSRAGQKFQVYTPPAGSDDAFEPPVAPIACVGTSQQTFIISLSILGAVAGGKVGIQLRKISIQDQGSTQDPNANAGNEWSVQSIGFN